MTFRPRELLQVLSDHGVKFVIIGGFAVSAHGHPRATRDLDVVPEPSAENMQRLAAAIEKLDGHLVGVDADLLGIQLDAETFAEGANFPLDTTYGRLDILQEMRDQKLHGQIAQDAIEVSIDGVQVLVCSLRALRELKQAAGRPQDIADLEALAGNEG
ncbi:MAG: nucleotidyltransferase [Thermoleophilaceae bacterium]|nr:nucleotidyltransferase [Thermoleophilaceae bacterium]